MSKPMKRVFSLVMKALCFAMQAMVGQSQDGHRSGLRLLFRIHNNNNNGQYITI